MKLRYLGHSCFSVENNDITFFIDPFISGNGKAENIDLDMLNPDYIFVTHAHQDHILDVEAIAEQSGATVVSNFEICSKFSQRGLETYPLNHGGRLEFELGSAKYVPAWHSSSFEDGDYGGNPGGFIFDLDEITFYHAGDTSLMHDMKLFGDMFDLEYAILPVGGTFTMGPKEACKATEMLDVEDVIGMHYDTFPPIEIDHAEAYTHFEKHDKTLHLMDIGEHKRY